MDKKTTLIIAAVIVVIIAAAAAFVLVGGSEDKTDYGDKKIGEIGTYITIYGNANSDLYIDENDVKMLESIVNGYTVWDKETMPYADANLDGKITEEDVQIVRNIIDVKECTVYYENYFGEATKINFPLKDRNIAVTYSQQAEVCNILGLMDNIKVASRAATDLYANLYPHLKTCVPFGSTGSSSIDDDGVEKMLQNDVSVVVCTPRTENQELAKRLTAERNMDFIMLWYNGEYCIPTVQTMGILFDEKERAEAYKEYCERIGGELKEKITDDIKKDAIVFRSADASAGTARLMVSDTHGTHYMVNTYLANAYTAETTNQFGFGTVTLEWVVANASDYDYFILLWYPAGFQDATPNGDWVQQSDFNKAFEDFASNFTLTKVYQDGNIVSDVYDTMFSYSAYAFLKILAAQMYPDLFSMEDAQKDLQYWYDNIDKSDVDVKKVGTYYYTGENYKTSY